MPPADPQFAVAMRNGVNVLCWCEAFEHGSRAVPRLNQATLFDSRQSAEAWVEKINPYPSGSTSVYFVVPLMNTLAEAVATVRELGFGHVGFDLPTLCRWTDAVVLLARHFLSLLDAGELVRWRGLEWVDVRYNGDVEESDAWLEDVTFHVEHRYDQDSESWRWIWWASWFKSVTTPILEVESLEAGKAAAEAYYRSRLAAALEPLLPEVRT